MVVMKRVDLDEVEKIPAQGLADWVVPAMIHELRLRRQAMETDEDSGPFLRALNELEEME